MNVHCNIGTTLTDKKVTNKKVIANLADMQGDEEDGRRYAVGQYWAHWAGNCRWCPTWQNNNGGFDGSFYVSLRGAANKEHSRPAYQMRDQNNENGVLTGLLKAGLKRQIAAVTTADGRHG